MTEASERTCTNQEDISSMKAQSNMMTATIEQLKVDDLENRARRLNLRLVGLPKEKKEVDMCAFLEKWSSQVLDGHNCSGPITTESAHRVGRGTDLQRHPEWWE